MNELFAKCIPFDKNIRGRIGGNPPICIEEQIPDDYKFYATLVHPERMDSMLSILIHSKFNTRIENNIYPSIAVKVMEHEYSEISSNTNKALIDIEMHSIGAYTETCNDNDFFFIKVGGEPRSLQCKVCYYKELERNNYSFFLMIDEGGYSDDLVKGIYVFAFGTLYLYKHNITGEVIAGFWL